MIFTAGGMVLLLRSQAERHLSVRGDKVKNNEHDYGKVIFASGALVTGGSKPGSGSTYRSHITIKLTATSRQSSNRPSGLSIWISLLSCHLAN